MYIEHRNINKETEIVKYMQTEEDHMFYFQLLV